MPLSFPELVSAVAANVVEGVEPANINAASIDVRLGPHVLMEAYPISNEVIALSRKENITYIEEEITSTYTLLPGKVAWFQTLEVFNLPNNIAAEFRLKSTGARNGLDLALALWCDPGWHGSVLTFQMRNNLQFHKILLEPGMKIGQVILHKVTPVPDTASYAARGQYNQDSKVTGGKGLR